MKAIGIMCEYNPFHNGHLYHLNKIKEFDDAAVVILILGGNFQERGEMSILNVWDKTEIALHYGVDLVIELPFVFATQSADIFAKGFIEICTQLKAESIVFGSESNDIESLKRLAITQLNNVEYNNKVKEYMNLGINYPTALSKALIYIDSINVSTPNDLLGLSYIREIIRQNAKIIPISIKRTNNYHDKNANDSISSATSIRECLKDGEDIENFVPSFTHNKLRNYENHEVDYFKYLKYKIISEGITINRYQTVDEGIENRIIKYINECESLEELITKIKTKRYTYNKLKRMFTHILCSFTKEEAKGNKSIKYIRVLGFNNKGKKYLNNIKKEVNIPIITNCNQDNIKLLEIDLRSKDIYNLISNIDTNEILKKPIIKED